MWMLLVLACASDDGDKNGEDTQPFMPPDALGLYSVSTQSVEVMSRHGFELPTQVWYPTTEESDDLHVYGDIKESPMAIDDADPDCSQIRPVVAFSHGNTGMRFQSYFFGEYLASHGYIVIAPDHVGNTIFDNDETRKPELILRRPEDISDSVDWLFDSEDFKDCVDPDAGFAMAGHSLVATPPLPSLGPPWTPRPRLNFAPILKATPGSAIRWRSWLKSTAAASTTAMTSGFGRVFR